MLYRRLADVVLILHALVVWFLIFGAFLCWQDAWVALIHIPLAVWVTAAAIMNWTCPLTPLENHLRKAAGEKGYEGSFVDHYLGALAQRDSDVNKPTSARMNQVFVGVFVGVLSLVLHGVNVEQYHDAIWPPSLKPQVGTVTTEHKWRTDKRMKCWPNLSRLVGDV